jgi:hypothetical protein
MPVNRIKAFHREISRGKNNSKAILAGEPFILERMKIFPPKKETSVKSVKQGIIAKIVRSRSLSWMQISRGCSELEIP